jgi:hypothetical protein
MSDVSCGRYRKVFISLWRHPGFVALSDAEKILAMYVLTGPQSDRLGLSVLSINMAAEDLGTVPQTLRRRLRNVCETFGWHFDSAKRVIYIPSWWRYNQPENVNVMRGSLKDLHEIPPSPLLHAFCNNVEFLSEKADSSGRTVRQTFEEGLVERLPRRTPNQNQDPDQKHFQEQEAEPSALRAVAERETKKSGKLVSNMDARVVRKAREVIENGPREASTDYLIDALQNVCSAELHIELKRSQAIVALAQSQQEHTA